MKGFNLQPVGPSTGQRADIAHWWLPETERTGRSVSPHTLPDSSVGLKPDSVTYSPTLLCCDVAPGDRSGHLTDFTDHLWNQSI